MFSQIHPDNTGNYSKGVFLVFFHKYNSIKGFYIFRLFFMIKFSA